jgi:hypothetical protein
MTMVVAGLVLCAFAQDGENLGKAAQSTQELESYKYEVRFEVQGGPGNRNTPNITGTYHKDEGLHIRIGDNVEAAKKGKKIVHVDESRNWHILEADKGSQDGDRRRDWQKNMLKNLKAPHEELNGIEKKFKEVKKAEERDRADDADCEVYSGELTPEGTKELMPNRGMLNRMEKVELKGSAKVWVNDKGVIVKCQIDVEASGEFRNNPFTVNFTRLILLSSVNDAQSEIPDEARKLLQENVETPSDK